MGIPLRVVERPTRAGAISQPLYVGRFPLNCAEFSPGDMWREPECDMPEIGRECWGVVLPNGRVWRTTDPASDPPHALWDVTGEPPAITVNPSINDTDPHGGWHGWIRDGELDDA